jgi:hypothetical protein
MPPELCFCAGQANTPEVANKALLRRAVAPGYPYASYRYCARVRACEVHSDSPSACRLALCDDIPTTERIEVLERYARTGNQPYACHRLVQLYRDRRNEAKAVEWMKYGAARGEPESVLLKAK